jgi:hypothetical protein
VAPRRFRISADSELTKATRLAWAVFNQPAEWSSAGARVHRTPAPRPSTDHVRYLPVRAEGVDE